MTSTQPRVQATTWKQLAEEPCPGCGMPGKKEDGERAGERFYHPDRFVLCRRCTRIVHEEPEGSESGRALASRITIALGQRKADE